MKMVRIEIAENNVQNISKWQERLFKTMRENSIENN
jgi:hypothetical protein